MGNPPCVSSVSAEIKPTCNNWVPRQQLNHTVKLSSSFPFPFIIIVVVVIFPLVLLFCFLFLKYNTHKEEKLQTACIWITELIQNKIKAYLLPRLAKK